MRDYHINLFLNEADGLWVADIPDLPGCSAHGETPEEAAREVQLAKAGWLEVAKEIGKPIPEPTYRPAIYLAG
jgi:predicted RNase H-like HicB family nuclease